VLYDAEATREIFLIFQGTYHYRFSFMLKAGFQHMFALERSALGWVLLDPSRANFHCCILPAAFGDDVAGAFARRNKDSTVMQVFVKPVQLTRNLYPKLGLLSCVSTMQYTLGVYWPWIITPYQLYCRLRNLTSEHIKVGNIWAVEAAEDKHVRRQNNPG